MYFIPLQVYEGVAKSGFILPEVLADHDVILTTYSTLRSDFYHLESKQGQEQNDYVEHVCHLLSFSGILSKL